MPPTPTRSATAFLCIWTRPITNAGLVAQVQSTVVNRLHLLAGVREAYVDNQLDNISGPGPSYDARSTKPLPRLGAAFDLLQGVTMFAGYAEGLRGERFFSGTTVPKPEQSQQVEGGLKLNLPSGLAGTLAVYDMTYSNVPTENPAMPLLQLQAGKERSKGFDADVTWQPAPVPGLSILASYAYVDARVVEDSFFPVGNRVDFVPQNSGRLWVNYKFQSGTLKDIVVGGGLYSATKQTLDLTDQFWTPGYTIIDGKIAYEARNWTMALIGRNLTNHQYYIPYSFFSLGRVAPGPPLTVLASFSVKK